MFEIRLTMKLDHTIEKSNGILPLQCKFVLVFLIHPVGRLSL